MKRNLVLVTLTAFLLTACSLPISNATSTPSNSDLETQVSALLTSVPATSGPQQAPVTEVTVIPTQNPVPTLLPTATAGLPTATQALPATNTPLPVVPTAAITPTQLPTVTAQPTEAATATPALPPTPTPAPVATALSTAAPTAVTGPTPTPVSGDPQSVLGAPTWKDSFADSANWPTDPGKYTSITIANHTLSLTGLTTIDGWRLTWPKLNDFYLEATIQSGACSGSDSWGLIARVPDVKTASAGYLVGLSCDGKYSMRKWDGTTMTSLIAPTSTTAILAGANQTNRLGLLAKGGSLTVFMNGTRLKTASDTTFSQGNFGLFVGASTTSNLTIIVSQIEYWVNPNL